MKARIFNIMQYERHPETGAPLLSRDMIVSALTHKSCTRWAFICHDKDVYSQADEEADANHVQGQKKPRHWHIVVQCANAVEVATIARWFGISENFIDVPKGAGAFLDCVEYLTHETDRQQNLLGKVLYEDGEVEANFDWRDELSKRAVNRARYGKDLNEKDQMRQNVLKYGWTLRMCMEHDSVAYASDVPTLQRLRADYLSRQKPPETRINFYVCGSGGVGKGLLSRALARSIFRDMTEDEDIFFEVGASGALFDGYDGQPVLIWNDRRGYDLLKELGGRGNVFNVFDTHPTKQKQNVKYSTASLVNAVNIVNSVQDYYEFLDALVGSYKDKNGRMVHNENMERGQSYRRFPFIIPLESDFLTILVNKGFVEDTDDYQEYLTYKKLCGNIGEIARACKGNTKLQRELEGQLVLPVVEKYKDVSASMGSGTDEAEEQKLRERFRDVGTNVYPLDLRKPKKGV